MGWKENLKEKQEHSDIRSKKRNSRLGDLKFTASGQSRRQNAFAEEE